MYNGKLNGFLEISFKIGKVLSSVSLFIVLSIALICTIVLCCSSSQNVETPDAVGFFEQTIKEQKQEQAKEASSDEVQNVKNSISNKYDKNITQIISENKLNPKVKTDIEKYLAKLPSKYKKQYLKGLNSFCKEGLQYIDNNKTIKSNIIYTIINDEAAGIYYYDYTQKYNEAMAKPKELGIYNYYISKGIVALYNELFSDNINEKDANSTENIQIKIIAGSILAIALILFTILLFLPVLIKIEENTRQK